jgi:hypothetical protein
VVGRFYARHSNQHIVNVRAEEIIGRTPNIRRGSFKWREPRGAQQLRFLQISSVLNRLNFFGDHFVGVIYGRNKDGPHGATGN